MVHQQLRPRSLTRRRGCADALGGYSGGSDKATDVPVGRGIQSVDPNRGIDGSVRRDNGPGGPVVCWWESNE